ncbi:MAG: cytochrome c maturation protein CcmE [Alphaproteobacteria bacterium]|nr:cytochrome c maturation protein CcmE [Pelagibacterales bacterium]MAW58291.1 cytochrome c maturation protein CcmE [Alphaproteobacteria bacterium]OUV26481.1 MAG: cytochrome c biogenesis protein CcmE [Alphaproteobacteria bacterium TMED109]|tara:strand:- start:721 stop:1170 length:450 start_codon:yes stop_codon:yes gene_type:complete
MNIAKLKRRKRLSVLFLAFIAISISGFLILTASRDSLIYFYSPTELLEIKDVNNKVIRIGGLVKEESIISIGSSKIEFIVEDGKNYLTVNYFGILPDLFREGQGVICEGKLNKNGVFLADKILAKHDENYMPPEVADALRDNGNWKGEE